MSKIGFGVALPGFLDDDSLGSVYHLTEKYLDEVPLKYESAWMSDHLIPMNKPYITDVLECLTTISYLLPRYPNLKFGQLVLCNNYRNPALLAKMSSTLQVISGGRFILGIGAGWYQEEYKQYGYMFPSPRKRVSQLEEAVQIIRMMWTEDDVTFHGKHYQIENTYCNPKPDPPPPNEIGGWGEKFMLKVVAKYADWWNGPIMGVETWNHKLSVLARHCDEVGRDIDDIVKCALWFVSVADSDEKALELAKRSPYYSDRTTILGSPESVVDKMGELVDAGVEYFQVNFPQYRKIETAQLFADEVIPEL